MKGHRITTVVEFSNSRRMKRTAVSILVWAALFGDVALTVGVALKTAPIYDVADLVAALLILFALQAVLVAACWGMWELKKYVTKLIIEKLEL